jgi:hypothetical protein
MDNVREVVVSVVAILVGTAILGFIGWLWRKARTYLDTQKRLEQQVVRLEQAVLAAEQKIARHDEELDYKRRQDALDRNMLSAERLDRNAHVESVRSETRERYGDLPERVGELEVAAGILFTYGGTAFDRNPMAKRLRQVAKDDTKGPVEAHRSDAPVGR